MPKHTGREILVTGATGHQGGATLRHLRERGFPVRALSRDPQRAQARGLTAPGVEVFQGNFDDPTSLRRALDGVYGVFSVQDWKDGQDAEIHSGVNMIDAARRASISHFVYSSVASADKNTGIPHFESKREIEEHLRRSGLLYTVLRPVFFMENLLAMRAVIESGILPFPLTPEKKFPMIAVSDIGAFAAQAFEHSGRYSGRVIELAGDEPTLAEIAQTFGRVLNRDVNYVQVPWDKFEAEMGPDMTKMFRWFEDVGYQIDIVSVRQEYPRLSRFEPWLRSHWQAAKAQAG